MPHAGVGPCEVRVVVLGGGTTVDTWFNPIDVHLMATGGLLLAAVCGFLGSLLAIEMYIDVLLFTCLKDLLSYGLMGAAAGPCRACAWTHVKGL
jgi:hypothetical protein